MEFKLDIERDRIWTPKEAEKELYARGYPTPWRRWVEGDFLVYQISPRVSRGARLGWQRGSGSVYATLSGGAFAFKRPVVVQEPASPMPQTVGAQLVAFPTSAQLVALDDELQRSQPGS